jgi:hypothetical protein
VTDDDDTAVVGVEELDVVDPQLAIQVRDGVGGLPAGRHRDPVLRRHRRDRDEPFEVGSRARHEPVHRRRQGAGRHLMISST